MSFPAQVQTFYRQTVTTLEAALEPWLLGFLARLTFFAVLYFYFLNSFLTKVGPGWAGFLDLQDGAYYQIVPFAVEAAGGDIANIPFFPWGLVVTLGTFTEFLLPLMLVLGFFTRIAALGMIGFITVQTCVDVFVHQVGSETVGALFDRFPDSTILDQRSLWLFLLAYLVVKGGGVLSLDRLLLRIFKR